MNFIHNEQHPPPFTSSMTLTKFKLATNDSYVDHESEPHMIILEEEERKVNSSWDRHHHHHHDATKMMNSNMNTNNKVVSNTTIYSKNHGHGSNANDHYYYFIEDSSSSASSPIELSADHPPSMIMCSSPENMMMGSFPDTTTTNMMNHLPNHINNTMIMMATLEDYHPDTSYVSSTTSLYSSIDSMNKSSIHHHRYPHPNTHHHMKKEVNRFENMTRDRTMSMYESHAVYFEL